MAAQQRAACGRSHRPREVLGRQAVHQAKPSIVAAAWWRTLVQQVGRGFHRVVAPYLRFLHSAQPIQIPQTTAGLGCKRDNPAERLGSMTQAEIIERIGFGCNGDRNEALFRAGYRPLRQSPFNPQSYEYVSYTHIDRSAEEEGIAFVRTRDLRSGSRTPAMTSDATMRGEASSESNRISALRADDARRMARASRRGR